MRNTTLVLAALIGLVASPLRAQEHITIHPEPPAGTRNADGTEFNFKPLNNPNYLDYGPLPDKPGSDHSMDYANQAGGNDPIMSGPGSDVDADEMPDSDGAYDE